ncbi:MAG: hypothetical protein R3F61_28920 [Myxococcota bacterium]
MLDLLEAAERPSGVGVAVHPERVVVRLVTPDGLHRFVVPGAAAVGALLGGLFLVTVVRLGIPEPWFSVGFLMAAMSPFLAGGLGITAHMLWAGVRANMVQQIELSAHRVVMTSPLGLTLWSGSVHELRDIWVHHDVLSAVLGLANLPSGPSGPAARDGSARGQGVITGLRVHGDEEARWLGALLVQWRDRHAHDGADADLERMTALGARASQLT